jgi:hypothetical protein
MHHDLDVAQPQGKHWLRALERPALALLVDTKHQSVVWCAQVQTDDIAQLLDEEHVGGRLEVLAPVRLQNEQLDVAVHAGLEMPVSSATERSLQCVEPSAGLVCKGVWFKPARRVLNRARLPDATSL